MKKLFFVSLLLFLITLTVFEFKQNDFCGVYCKDELTQTQIEEQLSDNVNSQLSSLDFSGLDEILNNITDAERQSFGNLSFIEKVKSLISGSGYNTQQSVWQYIISIFFDELLDFLPVISMVVAIGVTFSLVSASRPNSKNKSIGDLIHFICFTAIILLLINSTTSIIKLSSVTLQSIKSQIDIVMPILLTIMTCIGGNVSVGIYQPAVSILGSFIVTIFTTILMPIFIFILVFNVVSNISSNIKLKKFADFFSSLFKWIVGSVFTIFTAFLTIQGITAGNIDGISIRTAKYAIKNSVPLIGSYISDGFNLIVASSVLIKNGIGACGIILLFSTIVMPILKIIVFMLLLKLASAILEPISDEKISNFISMLSKSLSLLIVLILSCAFMYTLLCGMVICTANFI